MLRPIIDEKGILRAQDLLEANLKRELIRQPGPFIFGYQGGSFKEETLLMGHDFWFVPKKDGEAKIPRFWNSFGLVGNLTPKGSNHITVEINIPVSGSSKRLAALFAKDANSGDVVLLHRGKIGGGKKGVGKKEFLSFQEGNTVSLEEGTKVTQVLLVANLSSSGIADQIKNFVISVARFKTKILEKDLFGMADTSLKRKALSSKARPIHVTTSSKVYFRDIYVAAYVKRLARGICDLCRSPAPFIDTVGMPYLECHHIVWLSAGGYDTVNNAVALCPNCHRKVHILNRPADSEFLRRRVSNRLPLQ